MDFALNEEQQELKAAARAWLADKFPLDRDWENQNDGWSELEEVTVAREDVHFRLPREVAAR